MSISPSAVIRKRGQRRHSRKSKQDVMFEEGMGGDFVRGSNATIAGICVKSKGNNYSIMHCSRMKDETL